MSSRTLTVAALQTAPFTGDQERTLSRFVSMVEGMAATFPETQLIVAPEQFLSAPPGLLCERPEAVEDMAINVPGRVTKNLGELAGDCGMWLVPGTVYERGDDGIYNTALVFSPDGSLVARYRKVFPWLPHEQTLPGDEFVCFDIPGVTRVGLAICYDLAFPEHARQLAWLGAELIVVPTLTPTVDREAETVLTRAHAITNQLFVLGVNASSPAGAGRSMIVDPEGLVRCQAGSGEQVVNDCLDLDAVTRVRERGSHGLNRIWKHAVNSRVELPAYGGATMHQPQVRPEETA